MYTSILSITMVLVYSKTNQLITIHTTASAKLRWKEYGFATAMLLSLKKKKKKKDLHGFDYRNFWNTEIWKSADQYFCIEQLFQPQKYLPKWRRSFFKNRWRLFDKKLQIVSGPDYPIQILLACGINSYYGITNEIPDFRCQHLQR